MEKVVCLVEESAPEETEGEEEEESNFDILLSNSVGAVDIRLKELAHNLKYLDVADAYLPR